MKRMVHWSNTRETSLNPPLLAVIWSKGKAKYGIVKYSTTFSNCGSGPHVVRVTPF